MKFWKKIPSWLKGGIIGLLIGLILDIMGLKCGLTCYNSTAGCFDCASYNLPGMLIISIIFGWLGLGGFSSNWWTSLMIAVFNMVPFIIIGIFIGWIIGKNKKSK